MPAPRYYIMQCLLCAAQGFSFLPYVTNWSRVPNYNSKICRHVYFPLLYLCKSALTALCNSHILLFNVNEFRNVCLFETSTNRHRTIQWPHFLYSAENRSTAGRVLPDSEEKSEDRHRGRVRLLQDSRAAWRGGWWWADYFQPRKQTQTVFHWLTWITLFGPFNVTST